MCDESSASPTIILRSCFFVMFIYLFICLFVCVCVCVYTGAWELISLDGGGAGMGFSWM